MMAFGIHVHLHLQEGAANSWNLVWFGRNQGRRCLGGVWEAGFGNMAWAAWGVGSCPVDVGLGEQRQIFLGS